MFFYLSFYYFFYPILSSVLLLFFFFFFFGRGEAMGVGSFVALFNAGFALRMTGR